MLVFPRNVHKKGDYTECLLVANQKELKEALKDGYVVDPIEALTPEQLAKVREAMELAGEDTSELPKGDK